MKGRDGVNSYQPREPHTQRFANKNTGVNDQPAAALVPRRDYGARPRGPEQVPYRPSNVDHTLAEAQGLNARLRQERARNWVRSDGLPESGLVTRWHQFMYERFGRVRHTEKREWQA